MRNALLLCGILSSLLYLAMLLFVPLGWKEYSSVSQTVSELSAIGAPTRPFWVPLGIAYTSLVALFGWGVRAAAGTNRTMLKAGTLLVVYGLTGIFWPPMHLRGEPPSATDALHIAFSMATVLLMVLILVFASAALGRRFRIYTLSTLAALVLTGILTSLDGPDIARNLPTPWVGVWERISIVAYMVWNAAFAALLLRRQPPPSRLASDRRNKP